MLPSSMIKKCHVGGVDVAIQNDQNLEMQSECKKLQTASCMVQKVQFIFLYCCHGKGLKKLNGDAWQVEFFADCVSKITSFHEKNGAVAMYVVLQLPCYKWKEDKE